MRNGLILGFCGILLSGCQTLTPTECRIANWAQMGAQDGSNGRYDRIASHVDGCAQQQVAVGATSIQQYRSGYQQGLQNYCQPEVILDVAHNPHAAKELALWLKKNPLNGKTFAIFSILADKDIAGVLEMMSGHVDEWHLVPLSGRRAVSCEVLVEQIQAHDAQIPFYTHSDFQAAWNAIHVSAEKQDRVVAFGSFLVVSGMLEVLTPQAG